MLAEISCSPCGYPLNWTPPSDGLAFSGVRIPAGRCLDFDIHSVIHSDSEDHRVLETLDGKLDMSEWFQGNHRCRLIIIFNQRQATHLPLWRADTKKGIVKVEAGSTVLAGIAAANLFVHCLKQRQDGQRGHQACVDSRERCVSVQVRAQNTFYCGHSGPSSRPSPSYSNSSSDGSSCEKQSVS